MAKEVKLLRVNYQSWSKGGEINISYHMMRETEQQYKSISGGYGWIVRKEDIGRVSINDTVYVVADESNENQVSEVVDLLVSSLADKINKKIENLNNQNNALTQTYEKFKKGEQNDGVEI